MLGLIRRVPYRCLYKPRTSKSPARGFMSLTAYSNIVIVLVNPEKYYGGTILEEWYRKGLWNLSSFKIVHHSDFMGITSLHHGGGLHMDLDFVTLKPRDRQVLWNFMARESEDDLTNSIIHFERNHWIGRHWPLMQKLETKYDPEVFGAHGPDVSKNTSSLYTIK